MKRIDYSVPNKVKDTTPQFKVGDYVIGDCLYFNKGRIEAIEMSTGERKGLIYKVGINWYFYNFLKPWYDGIISSIIGEDKEYKPLRDVKFKHHGIEYTIKGITYNSNIEWCWLRVDKDINTHKIDKEGNSGIAFHELGEHQIKRIFEKLFAKDYSVWVGDVEVNDFYMTYDDAYIIAKQYEEDGYDDVEITKRNAK